MFNNTANAIDPDPYQGGYPVAPALSILPNFKADFLKAADIDAFLDIQNKVRIALPEEKKHHLKERFRDDLEAHLDSGMVIPGVKTEKGQLVAQCILAFAHKGDAVKNILGYPINPEDEATTAIVQSLCVDPAFKGIGLSQVVLKQAEDAALQNGKTQIVAKVACDNKASQSAFRNYGFVPLVESLDPVKHYPVTYFRLPIPSCDAA